MGGPKWTVYPGRKKSTIPQSTVRVLFMFGDRPWCATAALFVVTETRGNIRVRGGGRHGGWKAWPIGDRAVHFNGSARSHSIKTPQSTSGGAESPRERRSGCVLWCAFFWNYGRRGYFKASLNCDQATINQCAPGCELGRPGELRLSVQ
jgi:hypothetical protein